MNIAEYRNAYPYFVDYIDEHGNVQSEHWSAKTLAEELLRNEVKILQVNHIDTLYCDDEE